MGTEIKILAVLAVVLLAVGLSGCIWEATDVDTGEMNKFIGTWKLDPLEGNNQNELTTYIFYENETLISLYINYDTGETHTGWADYTVEGGKMCATTHPHGAITDNDSYCYDYEFSNGDTRVTLSTSELPMVTLVKVQSPSSS